MKGCIVCNNYYRTPKMEEQADRFVRLFADRGVRTRKVYAGEIAPVVGADIRLPPEVSESGFALFWDKDALLAAALEAAGLAVFNSARALADCDDKRRTHLVLARAGLPCPETVFAPLTYPAFAEPDPLFLREVGQKLGFPLVVKEAFGSYGEQVFLARDPEELLALHSRLIHRPHLFQRFVRESAGRDVRVVVVGGRAAAAMERENPNDFRANVSHGGKMKPLEPRGEIADLAVRAARALGLDYGGVDLLLSDRGPLICEVNSNAHIRNILDCTGVDVAALFADHILDRVGRREV